MAFQVQLLGRFALRSATGDEISVPSKKGQALIAVLALADGAPVPRERLTGLLWSERGETQARGSLRQALTALRRVFEGEAPSPLVIEADHAALDLAAAEVDAVAASALATAESADDLERAASLYRGEFLAGLQIRDPAFDDWLAAERRRVQRQFLEVLGRLLAAHEADGNDKQAIATAERLLATDPLNESTHRALMRLYARAGERSQALGQYRLCCEALERELGVAPDPATETLYREIRAGETPSAQTPAATAASDQAAAPTDAPLPLPDKPSIAVLPFANLSGDPEQDYFADGITDEIITELIRFRSLFVIGSTSSFHYKGQSPKVQDVGRALGVAYVVEGGVRKAGNRVRITAQLVDAATGQHIWAERYDRKLEDIFAVQDEVTGKIVSTLAGHLEEIESRRVMGKSAEDLAAYDCVLLGEQSLREYSMDGVLRARQMFQQAVDLEPGSARAHTGLARSYLEELWSDWSTAPEVAAEQALVQAKKAVALDELDGRARVNLAVAYYSAKSNFELAEIQFDKALELNPNDADGYCLKGWCHVLSGQGEQAIVCTDQAMRLSPFDIYECHVAQFTAYYTAGRYEEAVIALGSIPDPGPDVSALLAACYAQQGRDAEAQRAMADFLSAAPTDIADYPGKDGERWRRYWARHFPFKDPAHLEHLIDGLIKAGLPVGGGGEGAPTPAKAEKPSIAVLPFVNLSDDPEQEYFADGMTRDLITELGRFSTLGVIAATTMFGFKGRSVSATEISRELAARYVLEGSVEKANRRIRISAQLTDAKTGQQVWGDRFDGDLGDLFEIRDEIMRLISSNLYQPLLNYESLKARQKPAASADAYDFYLRALHHIDKPTRAGIEAARSACRKALEIDPDFALVYELLMWTHLHTAWNGWAEDPEPELQAARREAARGVALDDKDPYLRGSFGFIEVFLGNNERGLKELQTAVDLVPSDSIYCTLFAGALTLAGRAEEALTVLEEAERLSPGYHVTRLFEGHAHFLAGRLEQALGCYEQFLTVLPEFAWAWMHVAACHVELGHLDRARDAIAKVRQHGPNMTQAYVRKLLHARDPAYVDRLLNALDTAGLPADAGEGADSVTDREEAKPSVAVLPFKNLSGDPEQDYFAEGITQDIVTELARFTVLQVVARLSAFELDPALEPVDASRRLRARYVVAGNVRKAGDRVRITAQLIDGESGAHLWAERYDRELEDIFAIQDEVVHAIVVTLGGQVAAADTERALRKRPGSLAAYDYYLRGQRHFNQYNREDIDEGRRLTEMAVALEPTFARAQAQFGWFNAAKSWWDLDNKSHLDRAQEYASKAVTLDPRDSVCWGFLAEIHLYRREYDLAERCVEQALTLNPNDLRVLEVCGEVLSHLGRFEEALDRLEEVGKFEPIPPPWYWEILGVTLFGLGRFAEAVDAFRRMTVLNYWSHAQLAACYGQLGETDKAQEHLKAYAADMPAASLEAFAESDGYYKNPEDLELWLDGLRKAGLE